MPGVIVQDVERLARREVTPLGVSLRLAQAVCGEFGEGEDAVPDERGAAEEQEERELDHAHSGLGIDGSRKKVSGVFDVEDPGEVAEDRLQSLPVLGRRARARYRGARRRGARAAALQVGTVAVAAGATAVAGVAGKTVRHGRNRDLEGGMRTKREERRAKRETAA